MLLLVTIVVVALAFDFTNGFHDTANAIATSVSHARCAPRTAVADGGLAMNLARRLRLAAASPRRSATGHHQRTVRSPRPSSFAALIGADRLEPHHRGPGIPSSSSHALYRRSDRGHHRRRGGLRRQWAACFTKVIIPRLARRFSASRRLPADDRPDLDRQGPRRRRPGPSRGSASCSSSRPRCWPRARHQRRAEDDGRHHAGADRRRQAQRPSRVPPLGHRSRGAPPWPLGTYAGGRRIIHTVGSRIIKLDPIHGFAAQTAAASVIYVLSLFGFPVSTTHAITAALWGSGSTQRLSAVRWGWPGHRDRLGVHPAGGRPRRRRRLRAHLPGGVVAHGRQGAAVSRRGSRPTLPRYQELARGQEQARTMGTVAVCAVCRRAALTKGHPPDG